MKIKKSEVVDRLYAHLLSISMDPDIGFSEVRDKWVTKRDTPKFWEKLGIFKRGTRLIARSADLLYGDDKYWFFNGKIYEPIDAEDITYAYELVLDYHKLSHRVEACKMSELFLSTLRIYNRMNKRNDIMAFTNGVLDCSGLRYYPFEVKFSREYKPEYHITYMYPFRYDPGSPIKLWNKYLNEVLPDPEMRKILQMYLGLGILDTNGIWQAYEGKDTDSIELCLLLIGESGTGKSVLYNTVRGIFGKERVSGSDYDEMVEEGRKGQRARLAVKNMLFNWSLASNPQDIGVKNVKLFKRIIRGEEFVDKNDEFEVPETFKMPFLIFSIDNLPIPDEAQLNLVRRIQTIRFDNIIPEKQRNPELSRLLVAEYDGIFNWILRGAREIMRRKFVFPLTNAGKKEIIRQQLKVDPVFAWANAYDVRGVARTTHEKGTWIPSAIVFASMEAFFDLNYTEMPNMQTIGKKLGATGLHLSNKNSSEGHRYLIYGASVDRLREPISLDSDDDKVDFIIEEQNSFLEPTD